MSSRAAAMLPLIAHPRLIQGPLTLTVMISSSDKALSWEQLISKSASKSETSSWAALLRRQLSQDFTPGAKGRFQIRSGAPLASLATLSRSDGEEVAAILYQVAVVNRC